MNKPELENIVKSSSADSASALEASVMRLAPAIAQSAIDCASAIRSGGRVLVCGNGGSAADAQHMAAELVGRFMKDRDPYAAVALTTDTSILTSLANDYGYDSIFERQVRALGRAGDVLVAISTSGNSPNVIKAIESARGIGMKIISLTGKGGGKMAGTADILLDAESASTPRIQEVHGFIIHTVCDLIERILAE